MTGNRGQTRKRLSPLRKTLFALVPLVLLLALAEMASRLFEPEPLRRGEVAHAPVQPPPRQEGRLRVVMLGESTMEGAPVPAVGIAAQLGDCLVRLGYGQQIELINLSLAGEASTEIARKASEAIDQGIDAIVLFCGHNEFLRPAPEDRILFAEGLARSWATYRVLRYHWLQIQYQRQFEEMRARRTEIPQYDRNSALFRTKVEVFRKNISSVVTRARSRGVEVILLTAPSNLLDWPPVPTRFSDDEKNRNYASDIETLRRAAEEEPLEKAREISEQLLAKYPGDASVHYWLGWAHFHAGEMDLANLNLVLARDHDPVVYRAPTEFNEFMRELARRENLGLVDLEGILTNASPVGIPGFSEIVDNCHPNVESSARIAAEMRRTLLRVLPGLEESAEDAQDCSLVDFLDGVGFHDPATKLEWLYWYESGLYCLRRPFRRTEVSREYFQRALEIDPDDWRPWVNLAALELFAGDAAAAEDALRRCIELRGDLPPLDDTRDNPFLADALLESGITLDFAVGGSRYRLTLENGRPASIVESSP